jgi:hypothetical protein
MKRFLRHYVNPLVSWRRRAGAGAGAGAAGCTDESSVSIGVVSRVAGFLRPSYVPEPNMAQLVRAVLLRTCNVNRAVEDMFDAIIECGDEEAIAAHEPKKTKLHTPKSSMPDPKRAKKA